MLGFESQYSPLLSYLTWPPLKIDRTSMRVGRQILRGITWLAKPNHVQLACRFVTYGNEYTSEMRYSYAAIFAVISPFAKRQRISVL